MQPNTNNNHYELLTNGTTGTAERLNSITSEAELNEFKNLLAHYFAQKAQKAIDTLWDEGVINEQTIEQWGAEHMRTPYGYEARRP